tara:strand:- start:298 stop:438 length:141 start_codon:yes stop_codon:yes gene_type:complete
MSNKKSANKGTIIEKLKAMGLKIAPDDDPMYKIGPSIRFVSRKNKK